MVDFQFRNEIARSVYYNKYALSQSETWPERCRAIAEDVVGSMSGRRRRLISKGDQDAIWLMMVQMKFIPGGRYIYYAGRRAHFFNNCGAAETEFLTSSGPRAFRDCNDGDTYEVWSPVDNQWHLATFKEHGIQRLNKITFRVAGKNLKRTERFTADHRWILKDGTFTETLKVGDMIPISHPRVNPDESAFLHGFIFGDGNVHILKSSYGHQLRLCGKESSYLEKLSPYVDSCSYPPFANGDPVLYVNSARNLKELPTSSESLEYKVGFIEGWLAADGHAGSYHCVHTTNKEALDFFRDYATYAGITIAPRYRVITGPTNYSASRKPLYKQLFYRDAEDYIVVNIEPDEEEPVYCLSEPETQAFTLAGGMATGNCFLLRAEHDTREEWASLAQRATNCLMTGGGIGVDYSVLREKGRSISRTGGVASGPLGLAEMINNIGRNVMQGGSRRSAIYGSLLWTHPDARDWLTAKDWDAKKIGSMSYGDLKRMDYNFSAPLDMTNISLNYDDEFLCCVSRDGLPDIFIENMRYACMNGEPGFSFNFGAKSNETLRNACTEVTSEDDSDV